MIELLITLVAIGVIVYPIGLIPMDGNIKKVIQVVAVIVAVLIPAGVWPGRSAEVAMMLVENRKSGA